MAARGCLVGVARRRCLVAQCAGGGLCVRGSDFGDLLCIVNFHLNTLPDLVNAKQSPAFAEKLPKADASGAGLDRQLTAKLDGQGLREMIGK